MTGLRTISFCLLIIVTAFLTVTQRSEASTYYVNPASGLDSNSGATTALPFKTLQKAADSTHPGDLVLAMPGTYTDTWDADVVTVKNSGEPNKPIVYRSYKPGAAIVHLGPNNWRGFDIAAGTKYIVIDGFEIAGINKTLTWDGANKARETGLGTALYNGCGVCCNGTFDSATKAIVPVSHVTVKNCLIHDCAEGGIGTLQSDYLTITNNTIWNCAWYSSYNGSGISTCENAMVDNNTSTYKIIITGNKVYNCAAYIGSMQVRWRLTDGNGIIIDDADCQGTSGIVYSGKTLVADNLVYGSGGEGINVHSSNNVDVINNTLYHNANSHSEADTHIAAGGAGEGKFAADSGFSGGATDSPYKGVVDLSEVTNVNPAPLSVYQNERHGVSPDGFTYSIKAKPYCSYHIVLHFTEDTCTAPGQRQFNVSVNGMNWLNDFDIFASSHGMHRAIAEDCYDTPNENGVIEIEFKPGQAGVPKVDGIEALSDDWSPNGEICFNSGIAPSGTYHCYNNIIWPNEGHVAINNWNVAQKDIIIDSNDYYDGSINHPSSPFEDKNALWTDPRFALAGMDGSSNFHLIPGSAALKAGIQAPFAPPTDLDGKRRHTKGPAGLGAYGTSEVASR